MKRCEMNIIILTLSSCSSLIKEQVLIKFSEELVYSSVLFLPSIRNLLTRKNWEARGLRDICFTVAHTSWVERSLNGAKPPWLCKIYVRQRCPENQRSSFVLLLIGKWWKCLRLKRTRRGQNERHTKRQTLALAYNSFVFFFYLYFLFTTLDSIQDRL